MARIEDLMRSAVFYRRILRLFLSRKVIPASVVIEDYDRLARGYDECFARFTRPHAHKLIEKMNIHRGASVLDLACGTGNITSAVDIILGGRGRIVAVDASRGMLESARHKVKGDVQFVEADMAAAVQRFPKATFDFVTCGWAIGYARPHALLKQIKANLKPGGRVGIIENRQDTLAPLRETGLKVMRRFPNHIQGLMVLTQRLPKDKEELGGWFRKAGLRPLTLWQGRIDFLFKDGKEVLEWVMRTGASAGFDRMMDPAVRAQCDAAFVEIMERDYKTAEGITVSHKYAAGIAQRQ